MDIEFTEVLLDKTVTTDRNVLSLIEEALGGERLLEDFKRKIDYLSGSTLILGGYIDDELVCMNVFMQMTFNINDATVYGYQSGFSAASSKFRGKGLWPKLMFFCEEYLRKRNASFIFGFPNAVSHPVFIRKLGYESFSMQKIRITPAIFLTKPSVSKALLDAPTNSHRLDVLTPRLKDNIDWKKREYGEHGCLTFSHNNSLVWGRLNTARKFGVDIKYFEIGGLELFTVGDLQTLVRKILVGVRVAFCTLSINEGNEYGSLFEGTMIEETPLIIKMLGDLRTDDITLNFFSGMRDTF